MANRGPRQAKRSYHSEDSPGDIGHLYRTQEMQESSSPCCVLCGLMPPTLNPVSLFHMVRSILILSYKHFLVLIFCSLHTLI